MLEWIGLMFDFIFKGSTFPADSMSIFEVER
jgi:hypothetical protein